MSSPNASFGLPISCLLVALVTACGSEGAAAPKEQQDGSIANSITGRPAPRANQDRCLGTDCTGDPVLPLQPNIPFLAEAPDGWLRLIQADWELAPQTEGYRCVQVTVPRDVYITGFSSMSPTGTHHTVLLARKEVGTDGVRVCDGSSSGSGRRLANPGAGTEPAMLPSGVAMKLAAGETLFMNLHLFNVTDQPLTGTGGVLVKTIPVSQVEQEAAVTLAGPVALSIPPGRTTVKATCTLGAVTLFSLAPHMHQFGAHMKITAHRAGSTRVLWDGSFDFGHQLVYPIEPVTFAAGDKLDIECTYQNTSTRTTGWGQTTLDEMCFAGLSLYPSTVVPDLWPCPLN